MADTNFSAGTIIASTWLDDVNTNTYTILGSVLGTNAITGNAASTITVAYPRGVAIRFLPVNNNTGAVTININGLGIRNVTKFGTDPLVANDLRTGMWAYVAYDGTQFQLINPRTTDFLFPSGILPVANGGTGITGPGLGRLIGVRAFLATTVYTPTAGTTSVLVRGQGAGGAGGGAAATAAGQVCMGGGGAAGGVGETYLTSGFSGVTITIGTGGVGASGVSGTAGTVTSFGTALSLAGGGGGLVGVSGAVSAVGGATGGVATLGNVYNLNGANSQSAVASFASGYAQGGLGAASLYGGGGQGSVAATGGAAGSSGTAASGRSAGGGGGTSATGGGTTAGGVGTGGIILVYEYA